MAKKSRPSFQKRQREMARQQRQQDKMARRLATKDTPGAQAVPEDVDPDNDPNVPLVFDPPLPTIASPG